MLTITSSGRDLPSNSQSCHVNGTIFTRLETPQTYLATQTRALFRDASSDALSLQNDSLRSKSMFVFDSFCAARGK